MARTFDAQRFFLTYSQAADILPENVADFLIGLTPTPTFVEVGTEHHRDGGIHYHAVVVFDRRIQRQPVFFDCPRYAGQPCHPNVLGIRNGRRDLYNRRHYIRKGDRLDDATHKPKSHVDTPCDYDHEPISRGTPPPYVDETRSLPWGDILEMATTEAEFLRLVQQHHPADWILRNAAIVSFAKSNYHRVAPFEPQFVREDFTPVAAIDQWLLEVKQKVCTFLK